MGIQDYKSLNFSCDEAFREILIAELSVLDFDSMMETKDGLETYIESEKLNLEEVDEIVSRYSDAGLSYSVTLVTSRNWNEEWEKNYDPINVDNQILVRASFHEAKSFPYEIIVNPRMSFGTGHHATTYLMLKNQLSIDHTNKRVLDAGCGTAILAIMAEKLGASETVAYDNNSWSIENAPENVGLNNCTNITVLEGTIDTITISGTFDIILANINKNVLLEEMNKYVQVLSDDGLICFSGFYEDDNTDLINQAQKNRLTLELSGNKNHWSTLVFRKDR